VQLILAGDILNKAQRFKEMKLPDLETMERWAAGVPGANQALEHIAQYLEVSALVTEAAVTLSRTLLEADEIRGGQARAAIHRLAENA
jgi:hypothetical protein